MHMAQGLFQATFIIYTTTPSCLAPFSTTGTLFKAFFFISRTLKQNGLAVAFSITLQTELKWSHSNGLVEYDLSLFTVIPKYIHLF